MKKKVCLAGATGHLGQKILKGISESSDIELVACIGASSAGKHLSRMVDIPCPDLMISDSVESALSKAPFDILIDYTTPASVFQTIMDGIQNKIHCVIGTSGLSNDQFQTIHEAAMKHGVGAISANFSITATLMMHFATLAAKFIPQWEIVDYAPDIKVDAPSGTAREVAFLLDKKGRSKQTIPPEQVYGHPETRGYRLDGTQVHSIRLPGFSSSTDVIFGSAQERLSIRQDAMGDAPYVAGTLLAVRNISTCQGLIRGMAPLMNIE